MKYNHEIQKPWWAYFVLIGGAIFLVKFLPGTIFTFIGTFRNNEFGIFTMFYMLIGLGILIGLGWGMKRALQALRIYNEEKGRIGSIHIKGPYKDILLPGSSAAANKPIWPWIVISVGAIPIIFMGPAALMLPIFPIFLAAMSTDSGTIPEYIPMLIIFIGYGLMISYTFFLVKAIKVLRAK